VVLIPTGRFFLSIQKIQLRRANRKSGRYRYVPNLFNASGISKIAHPSDFYSKRLVWHFELQLKVQEKKNKYFNMERKKNFAMPLKMLSFLSNRTNATSMIP
jgi:hypothetical protein